MKERVKGRYFYLMLKDNFYDSDDMVLLESMENGYKYSNILLKLYLKSLKDKGKLMYKDRIPYNIEMLAKLTRHDPDVVRRAIEIFKEMGIIEILDNGAIFMMDIENYIGKSSTEADRRRAYDRRIAAEKQLLLTEKPCEESDEKSCEKSHAHIDLDLDLDLNLDQDQNQDQEKERKKVSKKASFDDLIDNYTCNDELKYELKNHLAVRKAKKGAMTNRAIELSFKKLDELTKHVPVNEAEEEKIKIVQQSIVNGWVGFFDLKKQYSNKKTNDGWDYINNEFEKARNDLF